MKNRIASVLLVVMLVVCLFASGVVSAETLSGSAKGFGGDVSVTLTVENGVIKAVEIDASSETKGIGSRAADELPAAIIAANGAEVDVVSGATVTSNAIISATKIALGLEESKPAAEATAAPIIPITASTIFQGFGINNSGRIGPGKDDQDVSVYGINQVLVNALFDGDGRILAIDIDQIEVVTPNYDGEHAVHFSGYPGQGGYNADYDHDEKVETKSDDTTDQFIAELASWNSKRDRGDTYFTAAGTWTAQIDAFQRLFVGMTVEEVKTWFATYTSGANGRPLKPGSSNEADAAKYDALSDEQKATLADVVSSATISLNDAHGDIIGAIENAYENRVPTSIVSANGIGLGFSTSARLGPGKDSLDVPVYSFNEVFANVVFDSQDRIAAIYIDQLEVATPNYDGEGMPHFSGFPGQAPYNNDADHDGVIDSQITPTEETFKAEISAWLTKRQRGDGYHMNNGTWYGQMNTFQNVFIGMSIDEVEAWFAKNTSDVNGRPLKPGSTNEQDAAKYDTLSDEEKAALLDVTSSATISLNDAHGNIIAAIKSALAHKLTIDVSVK